MSYKQYAELETSSFQGANTALQFSLIPTEQSPRMQNAYMDQIGDLSQRPGTIPVTATALGSPIKYLTLYKATPTNVQQEILAAAGSTLYKFNDTNALIAQTMTSALNTAGIYSTDFTNSVLTSILFITDQASMKKYNGAAVENITPASDDPSPNPPNYMTNINAKNPKYCWTYSGHVFVSPGNNEFYYSKRYEFDYFPSVQYFLLVRDNDFINGCGLAFNNVCLIPMRRGWGILTGTSFDDFDASTFLNTVSGVIAPRSIAKATYPNGQQTIIYLSDDGVQEIYDTTILDNGTRQYATRALMKDKIDYEAIGLSESEKEASIGYFDATMSLYFLSFKKGSTNYTYVFDVRNGQWYTDWLTFNAQSYVRNDQIIYFAGSTGHLHKFDKDLNSDWNQAAKTSGTPVHFKRYSPAMALEFSGFGSMFDAYLVESRQWSVPATLDVTIIFSSITDVFEKVIKNEIFVEDVSQWDVAKYANVDFTDILNEPNEILFEYSRLSKYVQTLWENPRDEPVKIFKEKLKGRISGR